MTGKKELCFSGTLELVLTLDCFHQMLIVLFPQRRCASCQLHTRKIEPLALSHDRQVGADSGCFRILHLCSDRFSTIQLGTLPRLPHYILQAERRGHKAVEISVILSKMSSSVLFQMYFFQERIFQSCYFHKK